MYIFCDRFFKIQNSFCMLIMFKIFSSVSFDEVLRISSLDVYSKKEILDHNDNENTEKRMEEKESKVKNHIEKIYVQNMKTFLLNYPGVLNLSPGKFEIYFDESILSEFIYTIHLLFIFNKDHRKKLDKNLNKFSLDSVEIPETIMNIWLKNIIIFMQRNKNNLLRLQMATLKRNHVTFGDYECHFYRRLQEINILSDDLFLKTIPNEYIIFITEIYEKSVLVKNFSRQGNLIFHDTLGEDIELKDMKNDILGRLDYYQKEKLFKLEEIIIFLNFEVFLKHEDKPTCKCFKKTLDLNYHLQGCRSEETDGNFQPQTFFNELNNILIEVYNLGCVQIHCLVENKVNYNPISANLYCPNSRIGRHFVNNLYVFLDFHSAALKFQTLYDFHFYQISNLSKFGFFLKNYYKINNLEESKDNTGAIIQKILNNLSMPVFSKFLINNSKIPRKLLGVVKSREDQSKDVQLFIATVDKDDISKIYETIEEEIDNCIKNEILSIPGGQELINSDKLHECNYLKLFLVFQFLLKCKRYFIFSPRFSRNFSKELLMLCTSTELFESDESIEKNWEKIKEIMQKICDNAGGSNSKDHKNLISDDLCNFFYKFCEIYELSGQMSFKSGLIIEKNLIAKFGSLIRSAYALICKGNFFNGIIYEFNDFDCFLDVFERRYIIGENEFFEYKTEFDKHKFKKMINYLIFLLKNRNEKIYFLSEQDDAYVKIFNYFLNPDVETMI